jgi:hypothetical protein
VNAAASKRGHASQGEHPVWESPHVGHGYANSTDTVFSLGTFTRSQKAQDSIVSWNVPDRRRMNDCSGAVKPGMGLWSQWFPIPGFTAPEQSFMRRLSGTFQLTMESWDDIRTKAKNRIRRVCIPMANVRRLPYRMLALGGMTGSGAVVHAASVWYVPADDGVLGLL